MKFSKKTGFVAGGTVVAMAASGVAFAAWTASGTGNGSAQSLAPAGIVVGTTTVQGDLYPSSSATGVLKVTLKNTNPYPVLITGITQTQNAAVTDGNTGCLGATAGTDSNPVAVTYAGDSKSQTDGGLIHLDGNMTAPVTFTSSAATVTLPFNASDNCKNDTFTVPVTVSGIQVAS